MPSVQRSPLSASIGGGVKFGAVERTGGSVQNQPSSVAPNLTLNQVVAAMVSTFTIDIPALAITGSSASVNYENPFGLPTFTLAKGATGLIIVSLSLATPATGCQVTFSQQLQYGGVAPSNRWTISAGGTFAGGKVVGVALAVAQATTVAQTITVLCNAHAYGVPATAT
jgi:hypothetical protein